jgi:hypothetical protein
LYAKLRLKRVKQECLAHQGRRDERELQLVGTGRFDGAEHGCAVPLRRAFLVPPLRSGDKIWGARDRQSRGNMD